MQILANTKLFNEDALSKAAATLLVEQSVLPGLEAALGEFGRELPGEEEGEDVPPANDPANIEP